VVLFTDVTTTPCVFVSATHAQGTFPERLESASNSFVCTRETALLWTVFNRTSTGDVDGGGGGPARRPQLIRFPRDRACRSAAAACEECLARTPASAAPNTPAAAVRNCTGTGGTVDGQLFSVTWLKERSQVK